MPRSPRIRKLDMTAEGRVWELIVRPLYAHDFRLTVRDIANVLGISVGGVHRTRAWRFYATEKKRFREQNRLELSEQAIRTSRKRKSFL